MARNYPRLDIYEFGEHLLTSGDLDPAYIALAKVDWSDEGHLYRWLLAYWCFYHLGAASYISDANSADAFWDRMAEAAANETQAPDGGRWPRGSERRHFRGQASIGAVEKLRARFPQPDDVVRWIAERPPASNPEIGTDYALSFEDVAKKAKSLPLFGPWISFKVADMLDRLGIVPVSFDQAAVFMFDDPTKAALKLWRERHRLPENAQPKSAETHKNIIDNVVAHLTDHFKDHTAPPIHERAVGLQEIETILCKWKSHMNGHYPLYNDIDEIREGLASWAPHSETAKALLHAMPKPEGE